MANVRIAGLIAKKLREGIVHPGDPERDMPPRPIMLPFTHAPGRPQEMNDLLDETVKVLSEAIVHIIEVDGNVEMVDHTEARAMRKALGQGPEGPQAVPLHCHCDSQRVDPLAILTVDDPDVVLVDGAALIRGLSRREVKCPHSVVK